VGRFGLDENVFIMTHTKRMTERSTEFRVTVEFLKQREWHDERLAQTVESYNLSAGNVVSLSRVFKAIDTGKENSVDIMDVLAFHKCPPAKHAAWLTALVDARARDRLNFGEYVTLVVSLSMMGPAEMNRWIFWNLDEAKLGYLTQSTFDKAVDVLLGSEEMKSSKAKMKSLFAMYSVCDANTDSEARVYFLQFETLIAANRMITFPILRFQDNVRRANLGPRFWQKKLDQFRSVRAAMNVRKAY
jgi:hypothetical protein